MSEHTTIEWCDHTFNPWIGCTKVSPGCANCYAETLMDKRYGRVQWGKGNPRSRTSEANWRKLEQWNRLAKANSDSSVRAGGLEYRPRVFVASLADWLDPEVPIEWLVDLLDLIRRCQHLDFLMLTKRPELWEERLRAVVSGQQSSTGNPYQFDGHMVYAWLTRGAAPDNVWIGTSVEDQQRADERIPALLRIPAKVRFLSCEPLLGPVDLAIGHPKHRTADSYHAEIHWVIVGGESGPGARPMHPDWARSLRDQCQAAGVAFFMKQMGGTRKPFPEIPEDLMIREFPERSGR